DEYRFQRADGTYATVIDRACFFRDADGTPLRLIGALSDVTERRLLEEKMHASQRLESVGRLAGGVAHEVNNALTGVIGFASLVQGDLEPDDPRREDVELIVASAERAARIAQQLLAVGRRQVMLPRLLDLGALVAEFAPMIQQAVGRDNRVEIRLPPEAAHVMADRLQLEQVLLNLALNARDAMPMGGRLVVSIEVDPKLGSEKRGKPRGSSARSIELRVSDSGVGMDDATRAKVFDPFFTTKPPGQGTGLGLSVVYGIVNQTGGHIELESAVGVGTTVRIVLPWVAAPAERIESGKARRPACVSEAKSRAVLVVDDEPNVLSYIARTLGSRGYVVHSCATFEGAMTRCALLEGKLDLVIADLVMPGRSGRELGMWLRNAYPRVPVLYVSGFSDIEMIDRELLARGDDFLQKPFTPDELLGRIRSVLG
ncbi:MAG: response regulator, partial [Polyangiaceae bacterium]|nr:response regulator [Polyangiaceae bacterium]